MKTLKNIEFPTKDYFPKKDEIKTIYYTNLKLSKNPIPLVKLSFPDDDVYFSKQAPIINNVFQANFSVNTMTQHKSDIFYFKSDLSLVKDCWHIRSNDPILKKMYLKHLSARNTSLDEFITQFCSYIFSENNIITKNLKMGYTIGRIIDDETVGIIKKHEKVINI